RWVGGVRRGRGGGGGGITAHLRQGECGGGGYGGHMACGARRGEGRTCVAEAEGRAHGATALGPRDGARRYEHLQDETDLLPRAHRERPAHLRLAGIEHSVAVAVLIQHLIPGRRRRRVA